MRKFALIPAYCEWHLIDEETHDTLHNLIDPSEDLYHENANHKSLEEIKNWCLEELVAADIAYSENDEYNGIWLLDNKRLQPEEMKTAADVMAKALYDYYIK